MKISREKTRFYRGVLENAGLGEVAFFLKKAKQNILYAEMALQHTDFSSTRHIAAMQDRIGQMRDLMAALSGDMEKTEAELISAVAKKEFEEDDEAGEE